MRNPTLIENLSVILQSPEGKLSGEYITKVTLRDLAAISVLGGLISDSSIGMPYEDLAHIAVKFADALLAELEKEKP